MSGFSWLYESETTAFSVKTEPKLEEGHIIQNERKKHRPVKVGFYAVYVVNILTNHGKFSFFLIQIISKKNLINKEEFHINSWFSFSTFLLKDPTHPIQSIHSGF